MFELVPNHIDEFTVFDGVPEFEHNYYLIRSMSCLKYGQIIRIRSYEKANTFLTSKSYTDPNLYFQIYNTKDLLPSAGNDMININNYRQSLFQVLPKGSFQINDEMNSQKVQAKKAQSAPRAKTQEQQFKAIVREKRGKNISFGDKVIFRHFDSQYYIYGSFDCATSGIGAFKIDLKKELSEKIIFQLVAHRTYEKEGDKISLSAPFKIYHCETQCYLSYCFEELFLDRGVAREIHHEALGRNDPAFPIDPPRIKMAIKQREQEQWIEDIRKSSRAEIMLAAGRYLIINQNIPKRVFKLVPHNEFEMKIKREAIKNHDVVYFIHTENDQYICPDNFGPQIFLKKRLEESDQADIFDGLWEIEEIKTIERKMEDIVSIVKSKSPSRKDAGKEGGKKFGNMLQVGGNISNLGDTYLTATVGHQMSEGQFGAGYALGADAEQQGDKSQKKKDKYILRHLASGRIMLVSDVHRTVELQDIHQQKGGIKKPLLLQSIDSKLQDGALVQFTYKRRKNQKEIVKNYLSVIKQGEEEGQIRSRQGLEQIQQGYEQEHSIVEDDHSGGGNVLQTAYNQRFLRSKLGLVTESAEHGFRIYKISEQVKQLCLFVLSSQQILLKFIAMVNEYELLIDLLKQLSVFLLNNVINVLKSLIGFIYDTEYNKIAQSGNNPNSKKQRIFDEVGMIELITRLLQVIHKRDFEEGDKLHGLDENHKSEYRKIRTVYELGYKLLQSTAAGNTLIKLKISRYLNNKYLHQILKKENRTVYRSIQEVLEGNILSLEHIHDDYIGKLIEEFDPKDPDPADLYFLSRLCLCGEKKVHKNQVAVFKSFYSEQVSQDMSIKKFTGQEEESLAANKFKFREDQQKMQILSKIIPSSNAQYRTLSELYEECNLMKSEGGYNPDKNHWSYFMQYLNLLADLCVQRNPVPLNYINRNLPLKTLVAFLHETTVKKNLLFQPFIRLVHHAFVQTSVYEQISRITKVKDWFKLGDFNIPKAKNTIPPDIKKTMTLIFDYIKRINKLPFEMRRTAAQMMQASSDDLSSKQPETIDLDVDDKTRLTNVKTFLQILKSTLNLGFWPNIDEMKHMVPFLLKVMRFDIEYCNRSLMIQREQARRNNTIVIMSEIEEMNELYSRIKKQLKLNKPNIVLLVECKILAAKILNIIIDYEFNVRVSIITKHFKDVMEVDVDLSDYSYDKKEFIEKWRMHNEYDLFVPTNKKEGYLLNQQLWMDKVDQILKKRDLFSQCSAENINPKLAFFQAFIYSNQQLTNLTLQLIDRITSQRREILNTFKDIIFVAGGVLSELNVQGLESTRSMLLNLNNPTIREPVSDNDKILKMKPDENGRSREGVIHKLASLTMSMMKKGNPVDDTMNFYSPECLYPFYDFQKKEGQASSSMGMGIRDLAVQKLLQAGEMDGSFLIITQKDKNLQLNQNLIKSQDHHLIVVDFLKIMTPLPQYYHDPIRALNASYNFLTVLVWNNNQNKKQLQSLLEVAEPHIAENVGCIDFFKEMYTNNKKLVKNKDIKNIIEKVIFHANQLSLRKYQKSKLLDFLRIAVIFDNKGYDINQNMVMEIISQYQVSSNNQIVYLAEEEKIASSLSSKIAEGRRQWFEAYLEKYEMSVRKYVDLDISPQLVYMATFFQIFSALIESQNVVNIGKAENMHPIQFLHKILGQADRCWVVIRHLRSYLNKLYYFEGRKKDSLLFKAFTFTDIPIIKEELLRIAELICNTPDYHMIKLKNPVRYTYLSSYVYLSLEEILHSLELFVREPREAKDREFQSYLNQVITQDENREQVIFNILEIIEYLEYLLKTIDGRYINKYMSKVSKRMRTFVNNIPLDFANKYSELSKAKTVKNIADNNLPSDDIPFKKTYRFHDGKGFWRHLLDWNSFKDQDLLREKDLGKVQKRVERMANEPEQAFNNRKRDYTLDLICLGNIDKRIQSKIESYPAPEKKQIKQDTKKDKKQSSLHKNLTVSESNRFDVKKQKFLSDDQRNITINIRRKKLVKFIEINQTFHKFSQKEISESLYDMFAHLREISAERYGFHVEDKLQIVDCEEVIKSIVKMNELDSNSIKFEYKLLIIRLLTNYIQRTSEAFKEDMDKWVFSDADKEKINEAQNFLHKCGVASFLSSLIINDLKFSIQMGAAILMMGITCLMCRSSAIQKELFDLIKSDDNNLLLGQINILVKDCGSTIAAYLIGSEQKEYNSKTINYSDTYDYYIDSEKIMKREFVYQPETVLQQKQFNQKVSNMQYAFIFLKNLCEGTFQIKTYIHEQRFTDEQNKMKAQSVDFLNVGISELKRMFSKFQIEIIKVPFAIIDFIYEVTQIPCLENQKFICQSSLFSDFAQLDAQVTEIIKKSTGNMLNKNLLNIFHLYSSNIKTVISCLEGNVPEIYENLSTSNLCQYFVKIVEFFITHLPTLQGIKPITCRADLAAILMKKRLHQNFYLDMLQVTTVIKKLETKAPEKCGFKERITEYIKRYNMEEYILLLKDNLLGIEIKVDGTDDPCQTLFFPKHNVFKYLSRVTRTNIMEDVDRSTQRDKIIGLIQSQELITEEIDYSYYLDNEYKIFNIPLSITTKRVENCMNWGLTVAAIICMLMLYFATVVYYPYSEAIEYDLGAEEWLLKIISFVQFSIALAYFFLWINSHMKLAIQKYERMKRDAEEGEVVETPLMSLLFKIPGCKNIYCLKQDGQFGNMMLFMFGSLMGMFYKIQWYSLLLMNLLMARLDVLNNIIRALKASVRMLGILSFFGVSFITFFSVFSMTSYVDTIYPDRYPDTHCQSVFDCVVELYIREQIGEDMQVFKGGRFAYDMIYVVFMDMLFGNILGGVLIDNFASLRTEREEMLKDKTEKCFICGIDKEALQKKSEDLKTHYIQQNHKLWNYVFYLYYLSKQPKKTGLEQLIKAQVASQDVSWIPDATAGQSNLGDMLALLQELIKQQKLSIEGAHSKQQ